MAVSKLTELEKYLKIANQCGDYIVMGIAFVKNDDPNNELTQSIVNQGLSILQKRHPFFRAYLNNDANIQVQNKDFDQIDLDWSDNSISNSELITQLEVFNSKLFDFKYKSKFVRCKVASFISSTGDKMYSINLALALIITDGINITAVTIELVNIINALLTNTECEEMKTVLEPVESLHHYVDKYGMFGEQQQAKVSKLAKNEPVNFLLPNEFRKYNEKGFKLDLFKIDKELTQKLIENAKSNNVKLTACLTTAIFYAINKLYLENNLEFPQLFTCLNCANLRFRYKVNLEFFNLRFHVCPTEMVLDQNELSKFTNLWQDAIQVHSKIIESVDTNSGSIYSITHNIEYLKELNKAFDNKASVTEASEHLNNSLHGDLLISNIGTYVWNKNLLNKGPIKIEEYYFSDSTLAVPNVFPALSFHINFWNDQIMFQLSSNKYVIGSLFTDRLMILLTDFLKNCAEK